jgi:hypothetical protein
MYEDFRSDVKFALGVDNWSTEGAGDITINIPPSQDDLDVLEEISQEYGMTIGSYSVVEETPSTVFDGEIFYRVQIVEQE